MSKDSPKPSPLKKEPKNDRSHIYKLYSELTTHKDHFSLMQNKYRRLSSTWLLAAFVGIGYLLTRYEVALPINPYLAIIILSLCTISGVTLLWHLDIVLYQKLWLAVVVEMASIEKKYKWLPRVNLNILITREEKKLRFFQSFFYLGANFIFLFIVGLAALFYFKTSILSISIIVCIILLAETFTIYYMMKRGGELEVITTKSFL